MQKSDFNTNQTLYHGSVTDIHRIDPSRFCGGETATGLGFYMSTDPKDASRYAFMAGDHEGTGANVMALHHAIKNPMSTGHVLQYKHIKELISASPEFHDRIQDFKSDDRQSDESALRIHARMLTDFQDPDDENNAVNTTNQIHGDFYGRGQAGVFLNKLHQLTGHDGMIRKFDNGVEHHVAWFPHQIKTVTAAHKNYGDDVGIHEDEAPTVSVGNGVIDDSPVVTKDVQKKIISKKRSFLTFREFADK